MTLTYNQADPQGDSDEGILLRLCNHVGTMAYQVLEPCCAVFSSGVALEVTLAVIAITVTPILLEARKQLSSGDKEGDNFRALPFL